MLAQTVVADNQVINFLTTLGVGGTLAAFMFLLYRRDIKQFTELWKIQSEQMIKIVIDNTNSNVKLISLIESKMSTKPEVDELKELRRRTELLETQAKRFGQGR